MSHQCTTMPRVLTAIALCLAAASLAPAAGVLSYWNLDDGSGAFIVSDPVGYKDGWLLGVPDGHEPWVSGHTGAAGDYAIDFAGAAVVDLGEPSDWAFGKQTPFSVSLWLKDYNTAGTMGLLTCLNPDSPWDGWGVVRRMVNGQTQIRFEMSPYTDAFSYQMCVDADFNAANEWIHVVTTYDGSDHPGGMRIYLDGQLAPMVVAAANPGGEVPTDNILTMSSYGAKNRFLNGCLDDVSVYDAVLTPAQVAQLFGGTVPTDLVFTGPGYYSWTTQSISSAFDAKTIAATVDDASGIGYRSDNNEKFLADSLDPDTSLPILPAGGMLAGDITFQLGPYDGDNTVLLDLGDSVTLDVADGSYDAVSVLFSAVGLNTGSDTNGTATLNYGDGSSETVTWDLVNNDGNRNEGGSEVAVSKLQLKQFSSDLTATNRILSSQIIETDDSKTLVSITLDTDDLVDPGWTYTDTELGTGQAGVGDAQIGIYAVSVGTQIGAVPEPAAGALLLLGGLFACFFRRTRKTLVVLLAVGLLASTAQAAGVLSYWDMNEGSGTSLSDSVGGKTGSFVNITETAWTAGHTADANDYSLDFGGAGCVEIGDCSDWNVSKETPLSVSAWIYDNGGGTMGILTGINPNSPHDGWGLLRQGGPNIRFEMSGSAGGTEKIAVDAYGLPQGQWVHVVATYDGSDDGSGVRIYFDGQMQPVTINDNNPGGVVPVDKTVAISSYGAANRFMNGMIDDVAAFDAVLSVEQVAELYAGTAPTDLVFVEPTDPEDWTMLDISASFNADTLAADTSDSAGTGYRGTKNEKFLADLLPGDGVITTASERYQFGAINGDNTVLMDFGQSTTIDIADGQYSQLGFAHTAIALDDGSTAPGAVTLVYSDSTEETFDWDVASDRGRQLVGYSSTAAGGLTLYQFETDVSDDGRTVWQQIVAVDDTKTLTAVRFDTANVVDPGWTINDPDIGTILVGESDAQFGIYAVSVIGESSAGVPGDLNGDGMVGSADLDIVRGNWGQTVEAGCLPCGDPSGDGMVGSADLDVVRANWGATAAAAVPEPAAVSLVCLLFVTLLGRRRQRTCL